ncbi:two-component system response regulator NarL [Pseudomonas segetis]|uniref:Two component transcriptional regulator, LuxR family n=1 Tax=Pseudomonas segetis TaxID=298908 RepID=A0A238ZLA6_9PSED|nr:two-component system response regulator NarL [Pseudomonas segetis]SNR84147.1 two component transcriptional regulator, LuxR family [Pseudomonas segetis]
MSQAPHTLLLVDDHPMMRRGIRQLIELEDDLQVVAEASNGYDALLMAEQFKPDLILLDNNMPQLNGIETLKRLREAQYSGKVLMFTVSDAQEDVTDALRLQADGFLLKDMEPEQLIEQLRQALDGQLVISPALTLTLATALRPTPENNACNLTHREQQVLKMIASGMSNKKLGNKLGISEGTAKVHVKNILNKLGVSSRLEAAVWALEHDK